MALAGTLEIIASMTQTKAFGGVGTAQLPLARRWTSVLADGTAAGKADRLYVDERTLTASASETLDLEALTDAFGAAVDFAKVKAIFIFNTSTANGLKVDQSVADAWLALLGDAGSLTIPAGGIVAAIGESWTVTTGAGKLKLTNLGSGSATTYQIVIVGTSA